MSTFQKLGIAPSFVKSIAELGIHNPTPIQESAIPHLLQHTGDLIAQAQTGTGKTAAFGLPLLAKIDTRKNEIQGLVVTPTRELAKQIAKQLFRFTKHSDHKYFTECLCGGENIDQQIANLQRPTHIVVATPGRLLDLFKRKALTLAHIRHLILDEADEMLSMGFKKELEKIFALTRSRSNTWLFSATIPDGIQQLVKAYMAHDAHILKIDKKHIVNRDIDHRFTTLARDEKTEFITHFLKKQPEERGVIFCRTRAGAILLAKQLTARNLPVDVIHGDLTQKERDKVMRAFKAKTLRCLIATDVAARGIDVDSLAFVIHHQLPEQTEYYTHRSGRTARAGKTGISIALIEPRERPKIKKLESDLSLTFSEI